jgi:uncharacterized SAM-binding protein YcdF (DUF218 family)
VWLSKLAVSLVMPLSLALLLVVAAAAFGLIRRRVFPGLLVTAVVLLWTASTPALSSLLIGSLENRFPPQPITKIPPAEAIVVLGGGVVPPEPPRIEIELNSASDRLLHTARLYRAGKAPLVIASGGGIQVLRGESPEAPAMSLLLQEWGVPATAILVESRSLNTRQNAFFSKQLLAEMHVDRILLVTSALHMPRALATFEAVGFEVQPAATDYHITERDGFSPTALLPLAGSLAATTLALREYISLALYRLKGW